MKTTYETGKALKFAEQDVFNEGCLPNTGSSYEVDLTFEADTLAELLEKIKDFYDVGTDDLSLDSCDEEGRLDIQVMETEDGGKASEREFALWEQGQTKLYLACYTYQVDKVTREPVKLS